MDMDSAYMALSGPLESLVKPELREEFYRDYNQWFPTPYCGAHAADFIRIKCEGGAGARWDPEPCCQDAYKYDLRTPGLFKEEFKGDGIVALNSKTYYCWNDKTKSNKYSSKGINKSLNNFTKDTYLDVLKTKVSSSGINKGFVVKDNKTYTYEQVKTGLTYFSPRDAWARTA